MSLAKNLAELHSQYSVYSSDALKSADGNILTALKKFGAFNYLAAFYDQYVENYADTVTENFDNDKRVRSKDLSFIGENVISTGYAKYFFVFEGSLSSISRLSITVLAHLWLLDNDNPIVDEFCGKNKWWNSSANYFNVKDQLNILSHFALDSYVTDAIRLQIGADYKKNKKLNDKRNQELLYKEIEILKPKLVICIGETAKDIVGMKYLNQDTKFHSVRFPKYHNEVEGYRELFNIMESI